MPKAKEKSTVTVPTEYSHLESMKIPSHFIKYFPLTLFKKMVSLKRVVLYGTSEYVHSEGGTLMSFLPDHVRLERIICHCLKEYREVYFAALLQKFLDKPKLMSRTGSIMFNLNLLTVKIKMIFPKNEKVAKVNVDRNLALKYYNDLELQSCLHKRITSMRQLLKENKFKFVRFEMPKDYR